MLSTAGTGTMTATTGETIGTMTVTTMTVITAVTVAVTRVSGSLINADTKKG